MASNRIKHGNTLTDKRDVVTFSIRRIARTVGSLVVDTLYPKLCISCGERGTWLCWRCAGSTLSCAQMMTCARCGHPDLGGTCACAQLSLNLAGMRAYACFDGWVADAVRAVKYDGEWGRAELLGDCMCTVLADLDHVDALIPVPLHRLKLRQRTFNQSELIAKTVGQKLDVPVLTGLERVRNTDSQTKQSAESRRTNVRGAFTVAGDADRVAGKHVVLMDDVWTTGSTMVACADELAKLDPASITAVTFAIDLPRAALDRIRADYLARDAM